MAGDWYVLPAEAAPFTEPLPAVTLPALQAHVGGYVEVLSLDLPGGPADMWCNEEGAYSGLPVNLLATLLAKTFSNVALMPEGIRGGAVLASADEMGETIGLPAHTIIRLGDLFAAVDLEYTT